MSLLCFGKVLWFFSTLRPSDQIKTSTYVLMDNSYPCFTCKFNRKSFIGHFVYKSDKDFFFYKERDFYLESRINVIHLCTSLSF